MGLLETDDGACHPLWHDHLVGRAPEVALRADHESISWRHASLRWTGEHWELQDLGSLNGTFLDDRRLEPGDRALLQLGAQIRFGEYPAVFELVEADPPPASAIALDTNERLVVQDGMIGLPDPDNPSVVIYRDGEGRWLAENTEGEARAPQEGDVLVAAGRRFRFEPGGRVYTTSHARPDDLTLGSILLEFAVSRNEEHVAMTAVQGARRIELRPRAHSYMLLTLARARLEDQTAGVASSSQGWLVQDDLVRMLATTPTRLALDIYRARRQFGAAGIVDATQLVERRLDSREVRLGVARLSVAVV